MTITGLYRTDQDVAIPLQGVHITASLVDYSAKVTIVQRYANNEAEALEVRYVFPLDDAAAVCSFEASIDGKVIAGVVKETEEAKEIYDDAIASGKGAYLLESIAPDVFQASVGNLPPQKEVEIRITYVIELKSKTEDNSIQFMLPMTIAPRYTQKSPTDQTQLNIVHSDKEELTYEMDMEMDIKMSCDVTKIVSESVPIKSKIRGNIATVNLTDNTPLDKDLYISIMLEEPHTPRVWVEELPSSSKSIESFPPLASMLTFYPDFGDSEVASEIIFVVDRSGSMSGNISEARATLVQSLNTLPSTCLFNIIGFGSSHQSLFDKSEPCNDTFIQKAKDHVSTMNADLGGTELLQPFQYIFQLPVKKGFSRQIFLITDGGVSNPDACFQIVRKNAHNTRVFTFGIGHGVSTSLVKGVAEAGKGYAEFITENSSEQSMETSIVRQVKRALRPCITDVSLEWDGIDPEKVVQSPTVLPPLFSQEKYVVYAFIPPFSKCKATLKANSTEGHLKFKLAVSSSNILVDTCIHTLAAKMLIKELESGDRGDKLGNDKAKKEIIQLGTTFGLASKYTSFVCVEDRTDAQVSTMQLRDVPSVTPANKKQKVSNSFPASYTSYRGGGGATATRSKSVQFCSLPNSKKRKGMSSGLKPAMTPFGFTALVASSDVEDPMLTHVFKGPKNNAVGLDCWLNAALMLWSSIETFTEKLLQLWVERSLKKNSMQRALADYVAVMGDQTSIDFNKSLVDAHKAVWKHFESIGYTKGQNHSIVTAFQVLLKEMESLVERDWEILSIRRDTEITEIADKTKYLIVINETILPLKVTVLNKFTKHSFVAFENMGLNWKGDLISHFTCWALTEDGYFIYDDLLRLQPGCWQGGFVLKSAPCYDLNLKSAAEKNPIVIYKRK